jgi:hypothetical protein
MKTKSPYVGAFQPIIMAMRLVELKMAWRIIGARRQPVIS